MKKHLLTLALAFPIIINLCAQDFLSFPDGTKFFDVPGSTFLTARQIDLTTHISEHEEDGGVIWTDSVDFPSWGVTNPNYFINGIQRFGESDNYLVSVCTPNVTTMPWHLSPTIHLAIKVSSELQAIVDTSSIELNGVFVKSAAKNDSTVAIFPYHFDPITNNGYITIEINDDLNYTPIAPFDSIYGYGYSTNHSFYYADDTLYSYFYSPNSLGLTTYDADDISYGSFYYYNFQSNYSEYTDTYYRNILNDSVSIPKTRTG